MIIECGTHPGTFTESLPVCPKCYRDTHERLAKLEKNEQADKEIIRRLGKLWEQDEKRIKQLKSALQLARGYVLEYKCGDENNPEIRGIDGALNG